MSEERNAGKFKEGLAARGWRVSMTTSTEVDERVEVVFSEATLFITREISFWRTIAFFRRAFKNESMPSTGLRVSNDTYMIAFLAIWR